MIENKRSRPVTLFSNQNEVRNVRVAQCQHTGTSAYRGCPFINAAIELADTSHPGHSRVVANKLELRKRLTDLCRRLGARNASRLGSRLAMLINGAYSSGPITGAAQMEADLPAAAFSIVDASLDEDITAPE